MAIAIAVGVTGCTSANHYTTPRVLGPGEISVAAAVEATRVERTRPIRGFGEARTTTRSLAFYPALMVRRGIAAPLELGFALRPSGFGGEAKVRLWEADGGARAALLVAPSFQAGAFVTDAAFLLGTSLHERVEVFASPGLAHAAALIDSRSAPSGLLLRAGAGASVRVAGTLRVVPEITLAAAVRGDTPLWATGGIALAGDVPK